MGAEKTVPPGMGRRPIRAGKTIMFKRGLLTRPRKLVTRRCIWPASSMLWLSTRISETITAKDNAFGYVIAIRTDRAIGRGRKPKINPNAMAPNKNALPSDSFFLMAMRTRTKSIDTRTMAGIPSSIAPSNSYRDPSLVLSDRSFLA